MKNLYKLFGVIAFIAVIGTILAGCASMQLVSLEKDTVVGPKQVRQGDDINPKDIKVYGTYKDGKKKAVTVKSKDITFDKHKPGPQTVKITISKNEVSFQTQVMPLTSLTVTSQPTAKFFTGDDPDPKWPGLAVQGAWDQMGSGKIDIASCKITGFNKAQAGSQTLTVSYEGQTASFSINVAPAHPLNGQWNDPEPGGVGAWSFDNYGNYRNFSRKDGTGIEGTYTTANGKLTLTPIRIHGSYYPDYCITILMYTRNEMEAFMKHTEKGKNMTSEQVKAFLDKAYAVTTMDYSIDGDTLNLGNRWKYVKAQ